MSSLIITERMIEELIERTESTPSDMSPDVKVGDWVRMDLPGIMDFYRSGHVTHTNPATGRFDLAYSDRLAPDVQWIRAQRYYRVQDVVIVEHWRKIPRVVREPNAITVDSEWIQVPLEGAPCEPTSL